MLLNEILLLLFTFYWLHLYCSAWLRWYKSSYSKSLSIQAAWTNSRKTSISNRKPLLKTSYLFDIQSTRLHYGIFLFVCLFLFFPILGHTLHPLNPLLLVDTFAPPCHVCSIVLFTLQSCFLRVQGLLTWALLRSLDSSPTLCVKSLVMQLFKVKCL